MSVQEGSAGETTDVGETADDEGAILSERSLNDPGLYVNREISLLRFFGRVLEEAQDPLVPLLERVKFLAILGSILSEFFMVRVAGLKQQIDAHVVEPAANGMTPREQMNAIRPMVVDLMAGARECFADVLVGLRDTGIHITDHDRLTDAQQQVARKYFEEIIFPVLTPLAYDPGRPFPFISNMSLNLAVVVIDESGSSGSRGSRSPTPCRVSSQSSCRQARMARRTRLEACCTWSGSSRWWQRISPNCSLGSRSWKHIRFESRGMRTSPSRSWRRARARARTHARARAHTHTHTHTQSTPPPARGDAPPPPPRARTGDGHGPPVPAHVGEWGRGRQQQWQQQWRR